MTLRPDGSDPARRAYIGVTRGTHVAADDKPMMQELTVRGRFGEQMTNVEHWQPYGMSYVPLPPKDGKEAEVLLAYLGGSPDHPVVIATADRRHRPKDMKPGDLAHYDHRKQLTTFTDGGMTHSTPMKITHNTVDKDGKVMSSVVQHPDGKVTISNAKGAMIEMDGPNIMTKPGAGGKHVMDGDLDVKGGIAASKAIAGQSVTSGGMAVRTV